MRAFIMSDSESKDQVQEQSAEASEQEASVVDLGTFVNILVDWHSTKVALLKHLSEMPEGVLMSVNDGEDVKMEGPLLEGFRLGLQLALSELGPLPISKGVFTELKSDETTSEEVTNGTVH